MIIEIIEKDLKGAVVTNCKKCIVANALKRIHGNHVQNVFVTPVQVFFSIYKSNFKFTSPDKSLEQFHIDLHNNRLDFISPYIINLKK